MFWREQAYLILSSLLMIPCTLLSFFIIPFVMTSMLAPPHRVERWMENPESANDYILRAARKGRSADTVEEMEDVLADCNRAVELEPDLGDVYLCRAFWLPYLDKDQEALDAVEQARAAYRKKGDVKAEVELRQIDRYYLKQIDCAIHSPEPLKKLGPCF